MRKCLKLSHCPLSVYIQWDPFNLFSNSSNITILRCSNATCCTTARVIGTGRITAFLNYNINIGPVLILLMISELTHRRSCTLLLADLGYDRGAGGSVVGDEWTACCELITW